MKHDSDNMHAIAAVNKAARSVGMSYGVYVSLFGGRLVPPEELVLATDPRARRCQRCQHFFTPREPRQIYCREACRLEANEHKRSLRRRAAKAEIMGGTYGTGSNAPGA